MIIARQSTARTLMVGPILDEDGAAVTGVAVGDLKISKNGAAPAALNGSATLTHRNTGHYSLALTTGDTDTVGSAEIVIDDTTNAMPVKTVTVIEEAVYDAMFAASAAGYNATAPLDAAGIRTALGMASADLDDQLDALPTAAENRAEMDSNSTQLASIVGTLGTDGDGLTALPWSSAWDAEVQSEVADALAAYNVVATTDLPSNFGSLGINASGHVSRVVLCDTTTTNTDMRGTDSAYTGTPPTAAQIADAVLDETASEHGSPGSLGRIISNVDTNVDAVLEDTGELQSNQGDWATATGFSTLTTGDIDARLAAYDPPTKAELDAAIAGLNDLSAAQVNAEIDTAIETYHLDHLLAAAYDPTSKPGNASGLLNIIFENDGGVPRFTENALEQAPSGGGGSGDATEAKQDEMLADLDTLIAGVNVTQVNGTAVAAGALSVGVTSPVAADGELTIYAGAEYSDTDGLALEFTITNYSGPDLTGDAAILRIITDTAYKAGTLTPLLELTDGVVTANGSTVTIKFEATETETDGLLAGITFPAQDCNHRYQVLTSTGSRLVVRVDGACTVKPVIA